MLDGVHPPRREGPAVAHPLDAEGDRLGVVAGAHEVGVDGVQPAVGATLDGAHGAAAGHDALGEHLAAEHPPVRLLLALPAEEGDVLGEGLGQRHRRLAREGAGGRQRLHAHLRRAELLEVEGRQEVEQGSRLVGGHRGNDSQATERARRPVGSGGAGAARPDAASLADAPTARTVSTARARRSTASTIDVGCEHVGQPHPPVEPTGHREAGPGGDEQPLVLRGQRHPGRVDAVGQLAPQEQPAARHPEAQLGQADAAARRPGRRAPRAGRRVARVVSPGETRISSSSTSCSSTGAPRSVVTRASTRPGAALAARGSSRCAGRPSATSTSCPR